MRKIIILCRHDERPDYDQIDTYRAALGGLETEHEYAFGELESLLFTYDGSELAVTLDGTDVRVYDTLFIIGWFKSKILEDVALSVATYMAAHGAKVVNTEVLFTRSRSKLSQYVVATLHEVPMTPFMFCMDQQRFAEHMSDWKAGYPTILKAVQASRGNDNYLVASYDEAKDIIMTNQSATGPWFVAQGFVPNDGDLRMIVMGGEVVYVIHRQSTDGGHLNNTSKGGEATKVDPASLPVEVTEAAVKLSELLRREVTGVDMIQDSATGKYYLLEVNNMPQLATGSRVAEKILRLDHYLSRL